MRPLQKTFSLLFLSLFIFISLVIAPQTHAAPLLFDLATQPLTIFDYGKEFCDKRSGDLMNLETWYSGKCAEGTDTLSGDGVGFSDIIFLQGIEYLIGPQYYSFLDTITKLLKGLVILHDSLTQGKTPPNNIATDQGLIPILASVTTGLITTKPASSLDYLAYVSSNLKSHQVIDQAFAAGPGYGFQALSPILPLWRAFRNIAYLLFALGFVLYGVMIMFRIKIDAKTAASIQLAIPKLIATLILITFSYAIVGLLIDFSTVISGMLINVLVAGDILTGIDFLPLVAGGQSFFGAIGSFLLNTFVAVMVSPFIVFNLLIGGATGAVLAGVVGGISLFLPSAGFFGVIIIIIIFLAIGFSYFKLIMKLFQAYFSVIISLIFSPILLLGNLLPGSNALNSWLMTLIGNLAVFPVASFFLVLSYALMCQPIISLFAATDALLNANVGTIGIETLLGVKQLSTISNIWTPPMTVPFSSSIVTTGGAQTGTYAGSVGSLILAAIGFGLLLMSSKYCEMVEKALKTPPFPYGSAIGDALKSGIGLQDTWSQSGYKLPFKKYTRPVSEFLDEQTPGQHIKPTTDALLKSTGG